LTGNGLHLTLDSQDGVVLSLTIKTGMTYGPAGVGVTADEAKARASQAVAGRPGAFGSQPTILDLAYIVPRANTGSQSRPPANRCELAYIVSFGTGVGECHVAAGDGSILGVVWQKRGQN
jgi:hypothetical protein